MRLQKYDFDIMHVPGKEMLLADALSRAYLEDTAQEGSVEKEIESVNMIQYLPIYEEILKVISEETAKDDTLIKKQSKNQKKCTKRVHYYSFQD